MRILSPFSAILQTPIFFLTHTYTTPSLFYHPAESIDQLHTHPSVTCLAVQPTMLSIPHQPWTGPPPLLHQTGPQKSLVSAYLVATRSLAD